MRALSLAVVHERVGQAGKGSKGILGKTWRQGGKEAKAARKTPPFTKMFIGITAAR
jgi:hypothetical protein